MGDEVDQRLLLGIDVGTSTCKIGVFTTAGVPVVEASASYPLARPRDEWVEQEPEDWWQAACSAIAAGIRQVSRQAGEIAAIGLCGQSPTIALLGEDGRALGPAILWQDLRADAEMRSLWAQSEDAQRREWFGLDLPPSPSWTAPRLLWLRAHAPALLERAVAVLQAKDWVGLRLTGTIYSDRWSMRGLVNARSGICHPDLLRLLDLPRPLVPACYRPYDRVGTVAEDAATQTGLPAGIPVAAGWADGLCGILGSGALVPASGEVMTPRGFVVSGSSEVVGVVGADDGRPAPGVMRAPIYEDGRAFVFGPTQSSGDALRWAARLLDPVRGEAGLPDLIERALAAEPAGLLFLPYLAGERAPIWDAQARGVFYGLTLADGAPELARAILEGIAYSDRHVLETAAAERYPEQVVLSGGGARSTGWNQMRADILRCRIERAEVQEGGTLGAAMLGAVAAGIYRSLAEASRAMVRYVASWEPDPARAERYADAYRRYVRLYPAVRDAVD